MALPFARDGREKVLGMCRPGGLSNAPPQEVGNLFVGKEDTLFAGKESPGRSVSRETVGLQISFSGLHLPFIQLVSGRSALYLVILAPSSGVSSSGMQLWRCLVDCMSHRNKLSGLHSVRCSRQGYR